MNEPTEGNKEGLLESYFLPSVIKINELMNSLFQSPRDTGECERMVLCVERAIRGQERAVNYVWMLNILLIAVRIKKFLF